MTKIAKIKAQSMRSSIAMLDTGSTEIIESEKSSGVDNDVKFQPWTESLLVLLW